MAQKTEDRRNLRQTTLDKAMEKSDKEKLKKVSFEDEKRKEFEAWKKVLREELELVRRERQELDKAREERRQKETALEETIGRIETSLKEIENRVGVLEAKEESRARFLPVDRQMRNYAEDTEEGDTSCEETGASSASDRAASRMSGKSRRSACSQSSWSDAEVVRMKKFMRENERKERERNIVIKGELNVGEDLSVWVKELLKDRLGVEVNIEAAWKGGRVIVARLGNVEEKRKVMMCKNKLAGSRIFIENDLCYEDRKTQEEIARWARCRREEGMQVKIGIGKILIDRRWIRWDDKRALREIEDRVLGEKEKDSAVRVDGTTRNKENVVGNGREEAEVRKDEQFFA